MAKMYFNYGAMNSGKSQGLINTAYNYRNQMNNGKGKRCLVFTSSLDTRSANKRIESRTGFSLIAEYITDDVYCYVKEENKKEKIYAILVDESQFLSTYQVEELARIVDYEEIPVICYGLKTDFQNKLFEGSKALLEWADKFTEIKTICFNCSVNKALMNLRLDKEGKAIVSGESIEAGDNYIPVCRRCYKELIRKE